MAGMVEGVLYPDQRATTAAELSRVIGDDDATLDAPGRAEWVAATQVSPESRNR